MQSIVGGINSKFWRFQKGFKNLNHINKVEKLQELDNFSILLELLFLARSLLFLTNFFVQFGRHPISNYTFSSEYICLI